MASLQRASHPLGLNLPTTETETETLQWDMVGHQREDHSRDGGMTLADQNLQEVCEPKPSLLGPKPISRIGCWNIRTMYECGKAAQVAKEMKQNTVNILGVSESRWTGSGRVVLADGTTIVYSGRKGGQHQGGVALMLNRLSAKALLE